MRGQVVFSYQPILLQTVLSEYLSRLQQNVSSFTSTKLHIRDISAIIKSHFWSKQIFQSYYWLDSIKNFVGAVSIVLKWVYWYQQNQVWFLQLILSSSWFLKLIQSPLVLRTRSIIEIEASENISDHKSRLVLDLEGSLIFQYIWPEDSISSAWSMLGLETGNSKDWRGCHQELCGHAQYPKSNKERKAQG